MNSKEHFDNILQDRIDKFNKDYLPKLDFDPHKVVIVHDHILTTESDYLEITRDYVVSELNQKGWDCKVVFFLPGEGFMIRNLRFYDEIVKELIIDFEFPKCNLFYLTGAARVKRNTMLYHKYCAEFNFFPITLLHSNEFEYPNRKVFEENRVFEKKFMCLNGRPRANRLAVISEIIKRDLKKDCFLSLNVYEREVPLDTSVAELFFPDMYEEVEENISTLELPLNLTLEKDTSNMHNPNEADIKLYQSCLFSLVTETLFFNNEHYYTSDYFLDNIMCYPCTFFTEKTWKCVLMKHPFVLCTTPYALEGFKELGYKTFHPYINEEYDKIEDDKTRLMAVMDEVERLCKMPDSEIKEWLDGVNEICEHNYNLLQSHAGPKRSMYLD